ncbi:MAG: Maf family protein [Chloroflexi bacterium]|nr:Maf family protein [Chloroflexota bacterium]
MLYLASSSPRRRELLALGGWQFTVAPAAVDERALPGEAPLDYVLRLAEAKARAAGESLRSLDGARDALAVAADTTVADGAAILGKPADAAEAEAMLRRLRARTHQVYTALAVLRLADGLLLSDWACTDVPMRAYSDAEMHAYIASGDPLDKAGAYGIQHAVFRPAQLAGGCYANVMGLPLCHLARTLARLNASARADLAQRCQAAQRYECSVYGIILG